MSASNEDLVRAQWMAWDEKDMDRVASFWDDGIVLSLADFEEWDGPRAYAGVPGAMRFLAEWMASFAGYDVWPEGFVASGDRVLVHVRHRGRRDGEEVEGAWAILYTLTGGLVTRFEGFSDRELAERRLRGE